MVLLMCIIIHFGYFALWVLVNDFIPAHLCNKLETKNQEV